MFQALRRINVAASDFPRSRRFYGETLGLPEAGGFENDWVEFALGPIILKLIPLRPGEVPARNQVAAVLSTDTLEETLSAIKERGVTVTRPPADEFTGRSAEILDPDGYRIIVFQASELHPDEEWVPMSKVDEVVKQKLLQKRQKEKGRKPKPAQKAVSKAAPKKATAKKPSAKKVPSKKTPAKKAPPKKTSPSAKKPAARKVSSSPKKTGGASKSKTSSKKKKH
jgi:predicted enzyme related to lactoylglutathione lyase